MGEQLLEEHAQDDELLVGIIGHEIGHRPWTWPKPEQLQGLTRAQLNQLHRDEEAKANRFAGRVLADLGLTPTASATSSPSWPSSRSDRLPTTTLLPCAPG